MWKLKNLIIEIKDSLDAILETFRPKTFQTTKTDSKPHYNKIKMVHQRS